MSFASQVVGVEATAGVAPATGSVCAAGCLACSGISGAFHERATPARCDAITPQGEPCRGHVFARCGITGQDFCWTHRGSGQLEHKRRLLGLEAAEEHFLRRGFPGHFVEMVISMARPVYRQGPSKWLKLVDNPETQKEVDRTLAAVHKAVDELLRDTTDVDGAQEQIK
jgi:hypothetical protein